MEQFKNNNRQAQTHEQETGHHIPRNAAATERSSREETTLEQQIVRTYTESIDTPIILDIIDELRKRSGITISADTLINPQQVIIYTEKEDSEYAEDDGYYDPNDHTIHLNASILHTQDRVVTLHTFIHELLHLVSDNSVTEKEDGADVYFDYAKIGLEEISRRHSKNVQTGKIRTFELTNQYEVANEGFTEFLTENILNQYLQRTGESTSYGKKETSTYLKNQAEDHVYGEYRNRVECYVAVIAAIADIPISVVEGALIRAYFRSEDPLPQEIRSALEALSPDLSHVFYDLLNDEPHHMTLANLALELYSLQVFSEAQIIAIMDRVNELTSPWNIPQTTESAT